MKLPDIKKLSPYLIPLAIILGIFTGHTQTLLQLADIVSKIFIKCSQLISAPIIFFAILSNLPRIQNLLHEKALGEKLLKYTIFITFIVATIVFAITYIDLTFISTKFSEVGISNQFYVNTVLNIIPHNLLRAFTENNILGVVMIAFMIGLAILTLTADQQALLHNLMNILFQIFLKITKALIFCLPIGLWAFTALFVK